MSVVKNHTLTVMITELVVILFQKEREQFFCMVPSHFRFQYKFFYSGKCLALNLLNVLRESGFHLISSADISAKVRMITHNMLLHWYCFMLLDKTWVFCYKRRLLDFLNFHICKRGYIA